MASFVKDLRAEAKIFSHSKPLKDSDLIFFGAAKSAELARARQLEPWLTAPVCCGSSIPRAGRRSPSCRSLTPVETGRSGGCEGGQLFRNAHRVEIRAAQAQTIDFSASVGFVTPVILSVFMGLRLTHRDEKLTSLNLCHPERAQRVEGPLSRRKALFSLKGSFHYVRSLRDRTSLRMTGSGIEPLSAVPFV